MRVKQRVELTKAGRLYSEQVRESLQKIERDTLSLAAHGTGENSLELAVMPTFAQEWLIPRLPSFYEQNPGMSINMGVRTNPFSFEDEHFEVAIHHGKPVWPRATSDLLFGEAMVVIARKDLVDECIKAPLDVLKFPLLYCTTRPESWPQWFEAAGMPDGMGSTRTVGFELHSMVVKAAESGLGIALVPEFFVSKSAWASGLVRVHPMTITAMHSYYLVYPNNMRHSAPLEAFRSWIMAQAKEFWRPDLR
ncbi:HTH-type transcriptional regulator PerR [Pseudomonas sp. AD21]|nr:HTH-type transcriptional regulator PerR [Pseudomonas sp. AD21]